MSDVKQVEIDPNTFKDVKIVYLVDINEYESPKLGYSAKDLYLVQCQKKEDEVVALALDSAKKIVQCYFDRYENFIAFFLSTLPEDTQFRPIENNLIASVTAYLLQYSHNKGEFPRVWDCVSSSEPTCIVTDMLPVDLGREEEGVLCFSIAGIG